MGAFLPCDVFNKKKKKRMSNHKLFVTILIDAPCIAAIYFAAMGKNLEVKKKTKTT